MSKHHVNAALRHRQRVIEALGSLTDDRIEQLEHKGRFTTKPDGYPTSTLSDGGSFGADTTSSTERSAVKRLDHSQRNSDPVGSSIRDLFGWIKVMSDAAAHVNRLNGYIDNVRTSAEGRHSVLAGQCEGCGDIVSGAENDRLRSGLCRGCYEAIRLAAPGDRGDWLARRRSA